MTSPAQRNVIRAATILTLVLWLYPPIAHTRQIASVSYLVPSIASPLTIRSESASHHKRMWCLDPHDKIRFDLLLARTLVVWTLAGTAIVAMPPKRQPKGG